MQRRKGEISGEGGSNHAEKRNKGKLKYQSWHENIGAGEKK